MKKQIYSAVFYLLFSGFLLSSCAVNRTIPAKHLDASIVPVDFNPDKQVLLVVQMNQRYKRSEKDEKLTQKMEGLLKQYYPYKYEVVSLEDISSNSLKYADTSVYKHALFHKLNVVTRISDYTTTPIGDHRSRTSKRKMTTTSVAYFFFDRVNKKEYNPSYQTPFLKSAVEALSNTVKKAKKV